MEINNSAIVAKHVKKLLESPIRIAVLTGAGVSTDSGIPDFKTTDSEWSHNIPRHRAISSRYFKDNPKNFWRIYREIFELKVEAKPNDFHLFLAELEDNHGISVITQNVDGLHTKAGSSNVIEIHGNANQVICSRSSCKFKSPSSEYEKEELPRCPKCRKLLKPDVVLFDEYVKSFPKAIEEVKSSDLIIVAGTSLDVHPFNELPAIARTSDRNPKLLWVNKTNYPEEHTFDYTFKGVLKDFLKIVRD